MFFIFSKILDFIISPLNWIVVLILLALLSPKKEVRRRYWRSSAALLIFFTNPFIVNVVMNLWEVPAKEISELNHTLDAGIMLGGTIRYYNSQVNRPVFGNGADRFMQVQELYHFKKIKNIIISSGSGSLLFDQVKEADLLKAQVLRTGIDSNHVFAESNSRNTYENAKETALLIKEKRFQPPFLLVTSAFHMRRSQLCFKKAGVEVIPFSVDQHSGAVMLTPDKIFLPSTDAFQDWNLLIHEWAGMVMYKMAGYI